MIGKKTAEIHDVPAQRLFRTAAAARYLNISINKLIELTDAGLIPAYELRFPSGRSRRAYRLEDLDKFIESMKMRTVRHRRIKPV